MTSCKVTCMWHDDLQPMGCCLQTRPVQRGLSRHWRRPPLRFSQRRQSVMWQLDQPAADTHKSAAPACLCRDRLYCSTKTNAHFAVIACCCLTSGCAPATAICYDALRSHADKFCSTRVRRRVTSTMAVVFSPSEVTHRKHIAASACYH